MDITMTMQQQQMQNSMAAPSVTPFRPPQTMPVPSSPVRSVEDSVEVLQERFFEWYITRYTAIQGDVLQAICEKLVDRTGVDIDTQRAPERGSSMTMAFDWAHWRNYKLEYRYLNSV
jgi:hypothetical protein